MSTPEQQNPDDDLDPLIQRMNEEFGPRREREPAPVYGEARPFVEQSYRLQLPLRQPIAIWVLLALNIAIFVVPTVLQLIGVRVGGVPINDYILNAGAKDNAAILNGQYYRLITSMFLHLGVIHIGVNAYSLY